MPVFSIVEGTFHSVTRQVRQNVLAHTIITNPNSNPNLNSIQPQKHVLTLKQSFEIVSTMLMLENILTSICLLLLYDKTASNFSETVNLTTIQYNF